MQVVSIDLFLVPEEAIPAFLKDARTVQNILREMPGLVEGFFYEKTDGKSEYNFITTAVWESEEAFANAGKEMWAAFHKQGFNPHESHGKLGVKRIRSEYTRAPY